jgi:hypothetical protein
MRFGEATMNAPTPSSRPIRCSWRVRRKKALHRVADAARIKNLPAVRAMLRRGFPVTARSQHGATPLHWATFHGNADCATIRPIDAQDRQFHGTAIGWLIHGALSPWGFSTGRRGECANPLLGAGRSRG